MLYVRCTQHTEYILSLSADKTTHTCSLFIYLVLGTWSQDTGVFCNQKRTSTGNCVCRSCCFNGGLWYVRVQHLCLSHHLPVFKTPAVLSLQNTTQCSLFFTKGQLLSVYHTMRVNLSHEPCEEILGHVLPQNLQKE